MSNKTVSTARNQLVADGQVCNLHTSTGKDGKERPRHVADRTIARELGIDHKTVSAQRDELERIGEIPQCSRQTKDGRIYPAERQPAKPTPEPARPVSLFAQVMHRYRHVLHLNAGDDAGAAMAILSISEAARTWRMGRTTIQRAIREGKLSAAVQPNGSKGIDTSEMVRAFGEPCIDAGGDPVRDAGQNTDSDDQIQTDTWASSQRDPPQAVAALQAQIDLLKAQLDDARDREMWFRRQLEDVQRLLPAPAPRPARTSKVGPALLALLLAALAVAGWRWRDAIISWLNR